MSLRLSSIFFFSFCLLGLSLISCLGGPQGNPQNCQDVTFTFSTDEFGAAKACMQIAGPQWGTKCVTGKNGAYELAMFYFSNIDGQHCSYLPSMRETISKHLTCADVQDTYAQKAMQCAQQAQDACCQYNNIKDMNDILGTCSLPLNPFKVACLREQKK